MQVVVGWVHLVGVEEDNLTVLVSVELNLVVGAVDALYLEVAVIECHYLTGKILVEDW